MSTADRLVFSARTIRNLIVAQIVCGGLTTIAGASALSEEFGVRYPALAILALSSLSSTLSALLARSTGNAAVHAAEATQGAMDAVARGHPDPRSPGPGANRDFGPV